MNRHLVLPLVLIAMTAAFGLTHAHASESNETAAIKSLIEKSYIHGAFNELDADAMRSGFHPDFAIYSPKGEDISKYPIGAWSDRIEQRKAQPGFDPTKNQWAHKFASIDVTGDAAAVKLELSKGGKLIYTDYLSLLRFDSGWRIVAKVYHEHNG